MVWAIKYNTHIVVSELRLQKLIKSVFLMRISICREKSTLNLKDLTLNGVPGEAQLADDVTGDVRFDALTLFSMTLSSF